MTRNLMDELKVILNKNRGIYILSDRNYQGSTTVFYRFGFFRNVDNCCIIYQGVKWRDYQKCFFDLPKWIEDPFFSDDSSEEKVRIEPFKNYEVTKILKRNNAGNVYYGNLMEDENRPVIFKENRPNILIHEFLEAKELRENEYRICEILEGRYFPTAIERLSSWINSYYVYEYIEGKLLSQFPKDLNIFEGFDDVKLRKILTVIKNLLKVIDYAHSKNIILDDIHPNNFIFNANLEVYYIDLEYAHRTSDRIKITSKNPGFYLKKWETLPDFTKDLRKTGQIVLSLFGKFNIFEGQDWDLTEVLNTLKGYFLLLGYQTNICSFLEYVLSTGMEVKEALRILESIYFVKSERLNVKLKILEVSEIENFGTPREIMSYVEKTNFTNFSLSGLAGYLWLLSVFGYREVVNKEIEKIFEHFSGGMLQVSGKNYSPYIVNGSAGIGLFLLEYDFQKYRQKIVEIADNMKVRIAKDLGFSKGLAGIAYFLLRVYQKTGNNQYLIWSIKQLNTCRLFAKHGKLYNTASGKYNESFSKGYEGLIFVEKQLEEIICNLSDKIEVSEPYL